MKFNKAIIWACAWSLAILLPTACTDNFEEININPVDPENASIEGIMAGVQYFEFAEPRFLTWRGNLIYSSRFAHQFSYNGDGTWFGGDVYQNNQGWTNAMFDASYQKVSLNIRNLLNTYIQEEDPEGAAVTRIMMSWFYQKMTDIFGDIPYSDVIGEALILENPQPRYDAQKDIYESIMLDLKAQMEAIGSASAQISGAEGDFIYNGDPQKWKAFANTLRLRMALRSRDAFNNAGESTFIDGIINDCLNNPLIDESNQALISKSPTPLVLSFLDGGLEDVYWGFGGLGSKWVFADRYIDMLKDNNDPRLTEMADSSANGTYNGSSVLGRSFADRDDLAIPSAKIIGTSTTDVANVLPTQVLTAAESYFLQSEAALLGYAGNAQDAYVRGIEASMRFWGVSDEDINTFKTDEAIATLSGDNTDQLNMVWNQRWLALLTNGYEGWALVRRTELIPDVTDNTQFFVTAPNNGVVPKRLPYSATEAVANEVNLKAAVARQGEDKMITNIWWDLQ
ncbi:SusD/RagB family nutrient-binding outer membrane lipoprotein [Fulvivirga sp. M361]|uniref:SusD/RagB family nutrient-binding outer membrane lipoprotein n=1 Tax=Fulvivirga sp. M361 TaxID=2594266 RepID=UPI00117BC0F1|nr:SusD/RagB family nutrient-binding outer membrane lipoprotein [Fulvivirga sp. M361]TRX60755.1 SusD/RagB family nutrient-binding outer membrane lipoprotein [Fulvivirga sp. M361]